MKITKLDFPIYTLDKQLLLPAGARIIPATLDEVISTYQGPPHQARPFLKYGTIYQDILRLIQKPPFDFIFGKQEIMTAIGVMEKTHFIPPVVEVLEYFKEYDSYTYGHSLIVFALATLMAQAMIKDSRDRVIEAMAGQMHDLGKVCVPLQTLKKSNPLTRTERGLLEHHTLAGYVLLGYFLKDPQSFSARIAKEHHERKDGSGYPLGILLRDRMVEIICACDIYDALLSPRPYRMTPYDNRTALEEITEMAHKGKLSWDVVQALVSFNRKEKPHFSECKISKEKRGKPPDDNIYGIVVDEDTDTK